MDQYNDGEINYRKKRWIDFFSLKSGINRLLFITIYKHELENIKQLSIILEPSHKRKAVEQLNKLSSIPFEIDYPENAHIVIMPTVWGIKEAKEVSEKYQNIMYKYNN